jgi:hypothetical protein
MAAVKAPGVKLLPKAKFPAPENRFPVKVASAKPTPAFDPRADQVLGKYQ